MEVEKVSLLGVLGGSHLLQTTATSGLTNRRAIPSRVNYIGANYNRINY